MPLPTPDQIKTVGTILVEVVAGLATLVTAIASVLRGRKRKAATEPDHV